MPGILYQITVIIFRYKEPHIISSTIYFSHLFVRLKKKKNKNFQKWKGVQCMQIHKDHFKLKHWKQWKNKLILSTHYPIQNAYSSDLYIRWWVCLYDTCDWWTNTCILANVCLLSNSLCACLSTSLSLGLGGSYQKTLVKQSSLDNDPFDSSNGEDNIFNDVDGSARQSSDDDMPPTPPRPATPTIVHQKTLPWKPKVRWG